MRNLFAALLSRSPGEMERIAGYWGVELKRQPPRDNVALLSREMLDDLAARDLLELLSPAELSALTALVNESSHSASSTTLPAVLGLSEEEASRRLASLYEKGLVFFADGDSDSRNSSLSSRAGALRSENLHGQVLIPRELAFVFRHLFKEQGEPLASAPEVEVLLRHFDTPFIEEVAKSWGAVALPGRFYRDELIQMIGEALSDPTRVARAVESLDSPAALLFHLACDSGGMVTFDRLRERTRLEPSTLRKTVRQLTSRAMAFQMYSGDKRLLVVPRELSRPPKPRPASANRPQLEPLSPTQVQEPLNPFALAWDLLILLDFVDSFDVESVPGASRFPRRLVKSLNDRLVSAEDPGGATLRLEYLHRCALDLKLMRWDGRRLTLTDEVEAWIDQTSAAQTETLYRLWLENGRFLEPGVERVPFILGEKLLSLRKKIVATLSACEANKWYSIGSLVEVIKTSDPFFLRSKQEMVRERGRRALDRDSGDWDYVEGRLISGVLQTSPHWLGVINLGRNERSELVAFELTELGARLIQGKAEIAEPPERRDLLIQPSFEILVFAPEPTVIWTLLRFTRLVRHDRVSLYTIDRESLLRGLKRGLTVEGVIDFLEKNSRREVPQNVVYSLRDWARFFRPVRLRWVPLLEVDDPAFLEEIRSDSALGSSLEKAISETAAMLRSPAPNLSDREAILQKLALELKKKGFYPEIE